MMYVVVTLRNNMWQRQGEYADLLDALAVVPGTAPGYIATSDSDRQLYRREAELTPRGERLYGWRNLETGELGVDFKQYYEAAYPGFVSAYNVLARLVDGVWVKNNGDPLR